MVLGRINRTIWGTKLLLTAVCASLVDCTSLRMSHTEGTALLFSANGCFNLPLAPHLPPPPTPSPIDSICDIIGTEKLSQKPAALISL